MRLPAIGGAYAGRTPYTNTQQLINWYVEGDSHDPKGERVAMPTPGLTLKTTVGPGPIRGIHNWNGLMFIISGASVYYVDPGTYAVTQITGTLNTSTGPVQMVDNTFGVGNQIFVGDGTYGYVITWTGAAYTFAQINFSGISTTPVGTITYQDGYGIFSQPGTQKFWITNSYNFTTYNPLYFASKEGNPDLLVSCISDSTKLFLLGTTSMEIWFDSGSALFPFQRIPGLLFPIGCAAAQTPARIDNSIVWLGTKMGAQLYGFGQVFQCRGDSAPTTISNPQMDWQINQYGTITDAQAFVYYKEGHEFYVLTFPTAGVTWVWDATNGEWHQRSTNATRWLPSSITFNPVYSTFVVGDPVNSNIYVLDDGVITDNGVAIARTLITPHLNQGNEWLQLSKVDVQGNFGDIANGSTITISWSQDNGHTFPFSYTFTSINGNYLARCFTRKLGKALDWVFKITTTSNPILIDVNVDVRNRATGRAPGPQSQMFPYMQQ